MPEELSRSSEHETQMPSEDKLATDILRYMLEHPDAADVAEGILAWWFSDERMRVGLVMVERVMQKLAAREMVVSRLLSEGRVLYSLNKKRIDDIERFIGK